MRKWYLLWVLMVLLLFQWGLLRAKKIERIPYRIHHLTPEERRLLTTLEGGAFPSGWSFYKSHDTSAIVGGTTDYPLRVKVFYDAVNYFAQNGSSIYESINYPFAYYYNNKTYVVYEAGRSPIRYYIKYWDHTTERWGVPVMFDDIGLGIGNDAHGAPAVWVNSDDKIVVAYNFRGRIKTKVSTNAEDITAWEAAVNPFGGSGYGTYPKLTEANNDDIYLFTMHGGTSSEAHKWSYVISTDGGASWGARNLIIEFASGDAVYVGLVVHDSTNDRFHMVWRWYDLNGDGKQKNQYHAYLSVGDGNMYDMAGNSLGTTITKAEADSNCLVVDSGSDEASISSIHLDTNEYPHIIYTKGLTTNRPYYYIKWTGAAWITPVSIGTTAGDEVSSDFIINSVTDIDAFLITNADGDLEEWNYNGSSWSLTQQILTAAVAGYEVAIPRVPINFNSGLRVIFSETDTLDYSHQTLEIYGHDGVGFVGQSLDNKESVFLGGKCNADFSDVRFTDDDGVTELYYWMDDTQGGDGDWRYFWVKVADDVSSNQTIYIHYGNSGASSTSDGANTFDFFDHFPGSSIDGGKWTETGTVAVASSIATLEPGEKIEGTTDFGVNYAAEARSASDGVLATNPLSFRSLADSNNYIQFNGTGTNKLATTKKDGSATSLNFGLDDSYYFIRGIKRKTDAAKLYDDGDLFLDSTIYVPNGNYPMLFVGATGGTCRVDWVFVRKWVSTEGENQEDLHGAWGAEESRGAHRGRAALLIPLMSMICRLRSLFR